MDRFIGRMLDNRYEILEVIGTGGMAVVYKARCHRLNRLVAIKILKDENLEDADFRRRFRAEGQAVGMLNHPNIVAVYDVVTSKDADYIVMELIDGISLKQYMEKKGVLNWKETLHFATQIAKALEHAHSKGLVHRDIKPHNVMVLKNGSVRVTDFGIARVTSKASTMTKEALGSVHYISPEQAKGGRVDCRSDLYSLGVVMYEMITGRPPFDGESPVTVALQHIAGGAAKPSVLNPNIPEGLEQIIMKAMAHDAKDRYANAAALLADLDEVRKEPTIVFPAEHMASAAKKPVKQPAAQKENVEKKKPAKEEQVKKEPESTAQKAVQKKQPKSREEKELSRDRVVTIVVVLCALAAMAAVVIFLAVELNRPQQPQAQMVEVPNVVGLHYERLPDYDVIVVRQSTSYSDEHNAGVIIRQLPEAGEKVEKGSKVFVVISLGEKPETVTMPQLEDMTLAEATIYLNGLNMGLKIEKAYQNHDTVPEGRIISVTPAAGTVLWKGATVTLLISEGKEIHTAVMPDLIQGAATFKSAAEVEMNLRGFTNVTWVPVESNQPEGKILSQSVPAKKEVDLNTPITIEYAVKPAKISRMPDLVTGGSYEVGRAKELMDLLGFTNVKWVEIDSTAPAGMVISQSEQAGNMVSVSKEIIVEYSNGRLVNYTIEGLPDRTQAYTITILHNGVAILVDQEIQPGQTTYTLELIRGETYTVYLDYRPYTTFTAPQTDIVEPEEPVEPTPEPTEPEDTETGSEENGE